MTNCSSKYRSMQKANLFSGRGNGFKISWMYSSTILQHFWWCLSAATTPSFLTLQAAAPRRAAGCCCCTNQGNIHTSIVLLAESNETVENWIFIQGMKLPLADYWSICINLSIINLWMIENTPRERKCIWRFIKEPALISVSLFFFVIPIDISKILFFEMHIENIFEYSFFWTTD